MNRRFSLLAVAAVPLAGCATVGPDYAVPPSAALGLPDAYVTGASAPQSPQELATWWSRLGDPVLDALIADSIAYNLDLAQARTRLVQARESLVQARAGYVPAVGASAGAGQSFDTDGDSDSNFSLGADAAWQADLFGGVSRGVEAARADADAVAFDLAAVRIAIIGEVATNYIQARLAQDRLVIARDTLAIADDNLEIVGFRVQAGLVSSLDQEQARANRAQTAASIPGIEVAYAGAINRLAVLTGRAPGALNTALSETRPVPTGPTAIATGIPADTLRQRPDVRAAERNLAAQTARIGVAQAALYPDLRLTGSIGSGGASLGSLVDLVTGNIFAGLSQTLFDGGRLRSQVRSQQAATEGALAAYRQSVLVALEDIENGLVALNAAQTRQREFTIALDASNNQAILARSLYRAGLTDFQTLLEAERSLLSSRDGLSSSRADQALAVVQLYLSLGGGWDSTSDTSIAG